MGRKRRNAYWNTPGGSTSYHNPNEPLNLVKVIPPPKPEPEPEPEPEPPVVEQPILITRRSLRQQARKAAQTSYAEDESPDNSDEEEGEDGLAQFTPLTKDTTPRKKRFLKDSLSSKAGRKTEEISESTSAVLNRLISKRVSRPGYVVKHGGTNIPKRKIAGTNVLKRVPPKSSRHNPPASTSADHEQLQESMLESLPLKVEIQEAPTPEGPKKRGRKRKVDIQGQHGTFASQPIKSDQAGAGFQQDQNQPDPDWDPNVQLQQQQQRKRGRQSVATANVKNRFPFCSICLSKAPPSDYIINHMSCPTEYQRMKRLFTYIYKDLKFPFLPFDMERENVFDYCDLPLCDCCIQLYREIYDSYCQIEVAKDQLKSRIERMVYQIQLSERNPAVAQQLTSIKNSPDSLMNKYCNFRRRYSSYKPGDSRGEVQGATLVPATIARIQIVKETHKRTAGTQTFLTAGHFPPPPPPAPAATSSVPVPVPVQPKPNVSAPTADSSKKVTSSTSSTSASVVAPVVIKKEVDTESAKTPSVTPTPPKIQSVKPNGNLSSTTKDKKDAPVQKPASTNKGTPLSTSVAATASAKSSTPTPPPAPAKPAPPPHSSVLTIIKTPGGMGPAIIRKLPVKPAKNIIGVPSKLLAIATPTHLTKTGAVAKPSANGPSSSASSQAKPTPEKPSATSTPALNAAVKDEPVDVEQAMNTDAVESDPFFSSQVSAETPQTNEEKDKDNDPSTIESEESNDSQAKSKSDSNVNYKHKKLRVVPVPEYKDSSNDSSGTNLDSKESEDNGTGNEDEVVEKTDADSKSKVADVDKLKSTSKEIQEDPKSKQVNDSDASPSPSSDGDKK